MKPVRAELVSLPEMDSGTTQPTQLSLAPVVQDLFLTTELSSIKDHLRLALTKQAMDSVAFLSNLEAYYNQYAPAGAEEYRMLVRAYAACAAAELLGGEW